MPGTFHPIQIQIIVYKIVKQLARFKSLWMVKALNILVGFIHKVLHNDYT